MAVGGTKDTNIVDSESPYRGTNQMASLPGMGQTTYDELKCTCNPHYKCR